MMDVFELRMQKVATLRNCPCCGEEVLHAIIDQTKASARTYFNCGSIVEVSRGERIAAMMPCPQPAAVAVRHLNDEVTAELAEVGKAVA